MVEIDRVGECESRQLGLVHRDPTSWVMLRILPHNFVPRSDTIPDQSEADTVINLINLDRLDHGLHQTALTFGSLKTDSCVSPGQTWSKKHHTLNHS